MLNVIIWTSVSAGIVADKWYGFEWAGNISIFVVWFFSIFSLLITALPDEKLIESIKNNTAIKKYIFRAFYFSSIGVMLAAGWFVTSTFSLIGFLLVYAKIESAKQTLASKAED